MITRQIDQAVWPTRTERAATGGPKVLSIEPLNAYGQLRDEIQYVKWRLTSHFSRCSVSWWAGQ